MLTRRLKVRGNLLLAPRVPTFFEMASACHPPDSPDPERTVDLQLPDELAAEAREWHAFAADVMRPAAAEHDREESIPQGVMEEAARRDIYSVRF